MNFGAGVQTLPVGRATCVGLDDRASKLLGLLRESQKHKYAESAKDILPIRREATSPEK